jgi:signal transduction histidine kinase
VLASLHGKTPPEMNPEAVTSGAVASEYGAANRGRLAGQDFFDLTADAAFVTDGSGVVADLNACALELVGAAPLGTSIEALVHKGDIAIVRGLIERASPVPERARLRFRAAAGRVARAGVRVARSRDGATINWLARLERVEHDAEPASDEENSGQEALTTMKIASLTRKVADAERDTHVERVAREDADGRERDRAWTMLVVSQSLRMTIESLQRMSVRLEGRAGDGADPNASHLARLSSLQDGLTEDLRDMARVADIQLRRGFRAFDPADSARFVAATFELPGARGAVSVECRCTTLGDVEGDEGRVSLALMEMVAAAVDLGEPGHAVLIDGERTADGVTLTVEWRGAPIAPRQLDWNLTQLGETGPPDRVSLCCLVARQLIQLHRGRLRFTRRDDACRLVATLPAATPVARRS